MLLRTITGTQPVSVVQLSVTEINFTATSSTRIASDVVQFDQTTGDGVEWMLLLTQGQRLQL